MIHGLTADPLFWACILGMAGATFWLLDHHWQRFTAWLFAASAACFTISIPQVFDALAALTVSATGLIVLTVLDVAVGAAFYLQAIRTHRKSRFGGLLRKKGAQGAAAAVTPVSRPNRYKPVLTPLVSILAGALGVITFGAWRILSEHASSSAAGTIAAIADGAKRVNDGTAAQAIPHSHLQGTWITLVVVFAVIALLMRTVHRRRHGRGGHGGPSGRGGVPVTATR
jgi:hypothetical protein